MKYILLFILTLFSVEAFTQRKDTVVIAGSSAQDSKYVMWYSPSNATEVYGVMFNFFPREARFPHYAVYGVELNLNPVGFFAPIWLAVSGLFEPELYEPYGTVDDLELPPSIYIYKTHSTVVDDLEWYPLTYVKKIYGLQITPMEVEPYILYGLDISLSGSFESAIHGAGISLIINKQNIVNGLTVATVGNHNIRCRGVQVGLVNTCNDLQGVQFGLWNVNQKRKLPLINWNFKRTVKKETNEQQ